MAVKATTPAESEQPMLQPSRVIATVPPAPWRSGRRRRLLMVPLAAGVEATVMVWDLPWIMTDRGLGAASQEEARR